MDFQYSAGVEQPGGPAEPWDWPFFDFGWHCVGDVGCGDLTITNTSPLSVTIVHVCTQCSTFVGSECGFFYIEPPAPRNEKLSPGESIILRICYNPYQEPPLQGFRWDRCFDAAVVFKVSGDPRYQQEDIYLEGKRTNGGCFLGRMATEQDFGKAVVGYSHEQTITLSNTGCEPLTVSEIVTDRAEFTVVSPGLPFTIDKDSHKDVVVRFVPSETGEVSCVLTVVSNAQNRNPATGELIGDVEVEVNGVGVEAVLGDVTGDTELNVLDVIAVVNIILGKVNPTEYELWAADMDSNGVINIIDAISLVNEILK